MKDRIRDLQEALVFLQVTNCILMKLPIPDELAAAVQKMDKGAVAANAQREVMEYLKCATPSK